MRMSTMYSSVLEEVRPSFVDVDPGRTRHLAGIQSQICQCLQQYVPKPQRALAAITAMGWTEMSEASSVYEPIGLTSACWLNPHAWQVSRHDMCIGNS